MKETELKSEKFLASKSQKRLHRWGYKDSGFELDGEKSVTFVGNRYEVSGTSMPDFIPYIESVLGIEFNKDDELTSVSKKPVNPPAINTEFFDEVKDIMNYFNKISKSKKAYYSEHELSFPEEVNNE